MKYITLCTESITNIKHKKERKSTLRVEKKIRTYLFLHVNNKKS